MAATLEVEVTEVERLRGELVAVLSRLHELPDDAVRERVELRSRQHELRAEMAEALRAERRAAPEHADGLRRELRRLRRRREQLLDLRTSAAAGASGSGVGSGGSVPEFQEMTRLQGESLGLHDVEARIREIEWQLEQLEDDDGVPPEG